MKKIMLRSRIWLPIIAVVALVHLFAFSPSGDRLFLISKNLDVFATLYKEVNTYYVDEVNPNSMMKTGIDAMLASLDPYTNYISEDDIEDYRTMTTGQYGGIGAVIGNRKGETTVLMPYSGYPADKAGLKIGDQIVQIDGIKLSDKNTADVSQLLKGQAGTPVKILFKRYGSSDVQSAMLTRERIQINNVPYKGMVNDEIGMITLTDFTNQASKEVRDALLSLKEQGAKKIILDLRGNPGGLLNEAVNISNLFIGKGQEVVSTRGKNVEWTKTYAALNPPTDTEIPIVVLTNSRSASASEIVAGVLQDYDRGVLIGQRSFGKGLVQTTRPLSYNAQLKVTTAKYYIPSGRCIQAIDYALRNEDGSVGRIPDSLQAGFTTRNGRPVFDGGGISPDIEVEPFNYAPISMSLASKGHLFDFATKYFYEHDSIAPAREFALTDAEYSEFLAWLKGKDYDYTTKVEKTIADLVENAKDEKYFDDIEESINSLQTKVAHNKDTDLRKFKPEIMELLEEEIVSRYYFQQGLIEASFDDNADIQAAISLLSNPMEYANILKGK